jgi:HlyD family secretion protein
MPHKQNHMQNAPSETVFSKRLDKVARRALLTSTIFGGLLLSSIFLINLEGAVISPATVVPVGENKVVQHREGGVIDSLLVSNGENVTAGQPLITLSNVAVKSEHNVLKYRRIELGAKLARLKARLSPEVKFAYALPSDVLFDKEAHKILARQENLFLSERDAFVTTHQKLVEGINALTTEITALDTQIATTQQQAGLIEQQISDILPLVQEQLVPKAREWDLRRSHVSVRSQLDSLNVQKVKLQSNLSNNQNELKQYFSGFRKDTLTEIEAAETELLGVEQQYGNLDDQLERKVIKAPVSGKVHELTVFNSGGVIRPGETVMKLVPQDQGIILSAKVSPVDIDQIYLGQQARLRFDAFDVNSTPEIIGNITHIAADMSVDEQTGQMFFTASISVEPEDLAALGDIDVVTGMPVTAMITTQSRTLFSYLTKPLSDHASLAFQ